MKIFTVTVGEEEKFLVYGYELNIIEKKTYKYY